MAFQICISQNESCDISNLEATERIKAMCRSPTKKQALGAMTKKRKIASGFEVLKLQGLTILSPTAGLGDWVEPRAVSFLFSFEHVDKGSKMQTWISNSMTEVVFGVGICWDHRVLFFRIKSLNACGFDISQVRCEPMLTRSNCDSFKFQNQKQINPWSNKKK